MFYLNITKLKETDMSIKTTVKGVKVNFNDDILRRVNLTVYFSNITSKVRIVY